VTGGNVSLYNETIDSEGNSQPIYPTPVIGMVGLVEDVTKVVGQGWKAVGDAIYLLGSDRASLAGSEYLASVIGEVTGRPQPVDFELERKVQLACRQGVAQGLIQSAHDCSEGGLAVAIAESSISGKLTAKIQLANSQDLHLTQLLFGEGASRIVVSVKEGDRTAWEAYLNNQLGNAWQCIGNVSDAARDLTISVNGEQAIAVSLSQITKNFNEAIPKRMGHIL
jgi:phosphoribosylformylglycinamidine synthase